jgi:hypothetical protein
MLILSSLTRSTLDTSTHHPGQLFYHLFMHKNIISGFHSNNKSYERKIALRPNKQAQSKLKMF